MYCDLGLRPFDAEINRAHSQLVGVCAWNFMIVGVKGKQLYAKIFNA